MRKPFHPPIAGEVHRPTSLEKGFIYGSKAIAGFGNRDFYVAVIPVQQARKIIIANHYSGTIVNNSYVNLGVHLDGRLEGVLQFGYALNPHRVKHIVANTEKGEYLELNRMWLSDRAPHSSESRAISHAFKYIARAMPMVKWVQSFADERCGRLGVVYQASNFLFVGSHKTSFYELDGSTYHEMLLTAHRKGGGRGVHLRANIDRARRRSCRQFRYIYFIKKRYRKDLRLRPRPYPKPDQQAS